MTAGEQKKDPIMRIQAKVVRLVICILFFGVAAVQARWMNTGTGRFYTMDTFAGNNDQPMSLHKYLYCNDNPLNGIDPAGNITVKSIKGRGTKDDLYTDRGSLDEDWRFTLDKASPQDGYIVQEIPFLQDRADGQFNKHYWEAWFVPASTANSPQYAEDHWRHEGSDLLKGTGSVHSTIKYFFKSRTGNLGDYRDRSSQPDPQTGWHPGDGKTWSLDLPWKGEPAPTWWKDPSDNGETDAHINLDVSWEFKQITATVVSEVSDVVTVTPDTIFQRFINDIMKTLVSMCLAFGCSVICLKADGQNTNMAADFLRRAPSIDGDSYYCGDMVLAVNNLRHLGKEEAIAVLRTHLREHDRYSDQNEKILLICRLLFVNPQGWKRPRLGEAVPALDENVAEKFPLFPLVISNGVPLLLVKGFNAMGYTSDTAENCVALCEGFSLVAADLSDKEYETAAQGLVKSETFQKLYPDSKSRKQAEIMVLTQAKPPSKREPKPLGWSKTEIKISP